VLIRLFTFLNIFTQIFILASFSSAALVDVDVVPSVLKQGTAFCVSVSGPERVLDAYCTFNGQKIPLFNGLVHGTVNGIGVIGREEALETGVLVVSGIDCGGDSFRKEMSLVIEKSRYEKINLRVASAMAEPPSQVKKRIEDESALLKKITGYVTDKKFVGSFERPVPGIITSPFGTLRIFNGKVASFHTGTDFRGRKGSAVSVIANGKVVLVKDLYYAGNTVVVDHGLGIYSLYAHLISATVSENDFVSAGNEVGALGDTGRVTAPHLHFGVKIKGEYIDGETLLSLPLVPVNRLAPLAMAGGGFSGNL